MSVLVTGGAGYVGAHTVELLRERGEDVVVFDDLRTGHRSAVPDVPLVIGDVTEKAAVDAVFDSYEVTDVIHFAGLKNPGESMIDPASYFAVNVTGTANVVASAHEHGVRRAVFSSSCSVYGTPARLPVDESSPLQPESTYGQTKVMGEQILQWYGTCHGLSSICLRYFNAAGASLSGAIGEDWRATRNLIPLLMKALLGRRETLEVFGDDYETPDGTAIRDYVHVVDLADAHCSALDHLRRGGASQAINLGTGRGSSVSEVIAAAEAISGLAAPVRFVARRPGDPSAVVASNTRAATVLGWSPRHDLDAVIRTAWLWHSLHLDGYES
jgi:UDP-glucose-4-epimerase GalE